MKTKFFFLCCAIFTSLLMVLAPVMEANTPVQAHAESTDEATPVLITDQGLDPQEVTVSVGSAVIWTNSTQSTIRLVGGELHQVYLPLAVRDTNALTRAADSAQEFKSVTTNQANWLNVEIVPGNAYSFTFTTAGNYPYYTVSGQVHAGQVVVGLPLFESVLYIENRSGSATAQDNPSLELGEGEFEDFSIEMFFYVPDLSYDGGPAVDGLARKPDSYSMYIDFHDTQPDLIMFEITLMTVPFDMVYQLTVETDISVGWHHIAFVFDNEYSVDEDAATIYLDGTRIAHSPDPGNDSFDMPQIMSNSWDPIFGGSFNSYIEDIRLSDNVRYSNTTYTVPTIPFSIDGHTRALWHFNETVGSTKFLDSSSYGNDLTGHGGAQTYRP